MRGGTVEHGPLNEEPKEKSRAAYPKKGMPSGCRATGLERPGGTTGSPDQDSSHTCPCTVLSIIDRALKVRHCRSGLKIRHCSLCPATFVPEPHPADFAGAHQFQTHGQIIRQKCEVIAMHNDADGPLRMVETARRDKSLLTPGAVRARA